MIISRRDSTPARTRTRAMALKQLHLGMHPDRIAEALQITTATVFNIKRRYRAAGLQAALFDQPRSGRPPAIDGTARARIIALADSAPPDGQTRWTLRLLADKAVELGLVASISHSTIKEMLKSTAYSRA